MTKKHIVIRRNVRTRSAHPTMLKHCVRCSSLRSCRPRACPKCSRWRCTSHKARCSLAHVDVSRVSRMVVRESLPPGTPTIPRRWATQALNNRVFVLRAGSDLRVQLVQERDLPRRRDVVGLEELVREGEHLDGVVEEAVADERVEQLRNLVLAFFAWARLAGLSGQKDEGLVHARQMPGEFCDVQTLANDGLEPS